MTYPVPRRAARRIHFPFGGTRVRGRTITTFLGTAGAIGLFLVGMGFMDPRERRWEYDVLDLASGAIRGRVSQLTPTPSLWS